jgi:hypothetical protein
MTSTQNTWIQALKPITMAFLFSLTSLNALAAEPMPTTDNKKVITISDSETMVFETEPETYNNETWQTPLAIEFSKLDTTGNGLLLPNEASKGKAFNKKSFAEADTDHDGTIDQNEYVQYKTVQ